MNNLLTYVLYALLIGLISVAGWKACQLKQEKALRAKEDMEMTTALKDLGYVEDDSTGTSTHSDAGSSTYKDGTAETAKKTAIGGGSGIEGDDAPTRPTESSATSTAKTLATSKSDEEDEEAKPSRSRVRDLDAEGSDSPKYMVLAGTFTVLDNARDQMESLVKQGFEDAEVGKFNRGKYACTIAKRTNSLSEANATMAKLKKKGYKDAIVKARK